MEKTKILDAVQINQKLNRMAYQVYENNFKEKELLIVGIEGNGYKVAEKIAAILNSISSIKTKLGKIKIDKENIIACDPGIAFAQIIPFKRTNWQQSVDVISEAEHQRGSNSLRYYVSSAYKKLFWKKKGFN
jgi:hypothetical protein